MLINAGGKRNSGDNAEVISAPDPKVAREAQVVSPSASGEHGAIDPKVLSPSVAGDPLGAAGGVLRVPRRLVVAVTGASGALYAIRFLRQATHHFDEIFVCLSSNALAVLAQETGKTISGPVTEAQYPGGNFVPGVIRFVESGSYFSPPASGSFRHDGMVIIPCSMGTIGRIASGISNDLTSRAADVCLKERRKLILVARETPLSLIHLRNMTSLTEAGATILPASPSFYNRPQTIEDIVDTVVARVLQNLGITQSLQPEWQVKESAQESE